MVRYDSPILKSVAYPPQLLLATLELSAANLGLNLALMILSVVVLGLSPLLFVGTAVAGHVAAILITAKDPHMVTVTQAAGRRPTRTRNLIPARGAKYVP